MSCPALGKVKDFIAYLRYFNLAIWDFSSFLSSTNVLMKWNWNELRIAGQLNGKCVLSSAQSVSPSFPALASSLPAPVAFDPFSIIRIICFSLAWALFLSIYLSVHPICFLVTRHWWHSLSPCELPPHPPLSPIPLFCSALASSRFFAFCFFCFLFTIWVSVNVDFCYLTFLLPSSHCCCCCCCCFCCCCCCRNDSQSQTQFNKKST